MHYIVTDHLGTPRELLSEDGEAVAWRAGLSLWGEVHDHAPRPAANDDHAPTTCSIRFQGQWEDAETGLYYNRFRYYDPDATQYLSPDPIGLEGGVRPQAYVADPNSWIDPLGLAGCPEYSGKPQVTQHRKKDANGHDQHARSSVDAARAMRDQGFTEGAYNRQFNTWVRDNPHLNLDKIGGPGARWRPDVIGYDPKTNTLKLVEVVSPSQKPYQMETKLIQLRDAIRATNPDLSIRYEII